jgi:hypothetical protein|tara:strand:+ start:792 stop:1529 length:738 start_codon:yes stop_codon:yes gene_type:complete
MALPIIETATYELTLPSKDVKIKYRPFLVKEEKVLLQALETGENIQLVSALKQICHACTFGSVNIDELPTFDLEYIFLQIRAKSVGEIVTLKLLCPDDNKTYAEVEVDLSKVEVHVDEDHSNKIVIDENKKIGLIMSYPTINSVDPSIDVKGMKTKQMFDLLVNSIHQIYEGEKMHSPADYSKEDLNKFVESLDSKAFKSVNKFFDTMPKLKQEVELENPKTKVKSKRTLSGLQDFFVSPSLTNR